MEKAKIFNVNVCQAPYNAAGEGKTNDRASIQCAIDDAANAGGGTVTLPKGHTFLCGEIELKSNVVLRIDGVLLKSNEPAHYVHPTVFGRMTPDSSLNWDLCSYVNYPLIYTRPGASNVTIEGSGMLDMNYAGEDETTLQIASIGLYDADHIFIRDITIRDSCQPQIWPVRCRHGEVTRVRIIDPAIRWNNEAICLCNCQNMHIHHNYSECGDDNIDVWESYQDRRMRVWCSSNDPQPSKNIEIDHNVLRQIGNGAYFNILPWGAECPDQEQVRIDNIHIHDNLLLPFKVDERTNALNQDYHPKFNCQQWNERSTYGHSPISNVTINNNGIGSDTRHDGADKQFPCDGFQTNDITDPWFANAISEH
jgi:polygalacturonase